MELARKELQ